MSITPVQVSDGLYVHTGSTVNNLEDAIRRNNQYQFLSYIDQCSLVTVFDLIKLLKICADFDRDEFFDHVYKHLYSKRQGEFPNEERCKLVLNMIVDGKSKFADKIIYFENQRNGFLISEILKFEEKKKIYNSRNINSAMQSNYEGASESRISFDRIPSRRRGFYFVPLNDSGFSQVEEYDDDETVLPEEINHSLVLSSEIENFFPDEEIDLAKAIEESLNLNQRGISSQQVSLPQTTSENLYTYKKKIILEDVLANPKKHLKNIVQEGIPREINLVEAGELITPALDRGGPSRQYISELVQALIKNNNLKIRFPQQLYYVEDPEEDGNTLFLFAQLIGKVHDNRNFSHYPLYIGQICDPSFFELVILHTKPNFTYADFLKSVEIISRKNQELKILCDFLNVAMQDSPNKTEVDRLARLCRQKLNIREDDFLIGHIQTYFNPFIRAAKSFCDGLAKVRLSSGKTMLNVLRAEGATKFSKIVQGAQYTKELVIQTFDFRHYRGSHDFKSWFLEFLDGLNYEQKEDIEWLKSFFITLTGSSYIQPFFSTNKILVKSISQYEHVDPRDRNGQNSFYINTCAKVLYLPSEMIGIQGRKKLFMDQLRGLVGSGFNTA